MLTLNEQLSNSLSMPKPHISLTEVLSTFHAGQKVGRKTGGSGRRVDRRYDCEFQALVEEENQPEYTNERGRGQFSPGRPRWGKSAQGFSSREDQTQEGLWAERRSTV